MGRDSNARIDKTHPYKSTEFARIKRWNDRKLSALRSLVSWEFIMLFLCSYWLKTSANWFESCSVLYFVNLIYKGYLQLKAFTIPLVSLTD